MLSEVAGLPHKRVVADCDVPEVSLFPKLYPSLKSISVNAGVESPLFMVVTCMVAALKRHTLLFGYSNQERYQILDLTNGFATLSSRIIRVTKKLLGTNFSVFNVHMKVIQN